MCLLTMSGDTKTVASDYVKHIAVCFTLFLVVKIFVQNLSSSIGFHFEILFVSESYYAHGLFSSEVKI